MLGKNGARRKSSEATMKDQSFLGVISRLHKNIPHKSLHHCSRAKEKDNSKKRPACIARVQSGLKVEGGRLCEHHEGREHSAIGAMVTIK